MYKRIVIQLKNNFGMEEKYTKIIICDDVLGARTILHVKLTTEQLKEILDGLIVDINPKADSSQDVADNRYDRIQKHPEMVFVKNEYKHVGIYIKDIVTLEANRSYCIITLTNGNTYQVTVPMKEVLDELDPNLIKRIHRSFCINIIHIKSIEVTSVLMDNKRTITIGRDYMDVLDSLFVFIGSRRRIKDKNRNIPSGETQKNNE